MKKIKAFFQITANKYQFEIFDITTFLTILNVVLIFCGVSFAPLFGIVNSLIFIVLQVKNGSHINNYVTQLMLIALNVYFMV